MNFKIILKIGTVACILASVLTVFFTNLNYQNYVIENNKAILRVLSLFLENPETTKDDIVKIIDNTNDTNLDILKEYGYDLDTKFFVDTNEKNLNKNILINLSISNSFVIFSLFIFYLYQKRRGKKIDKLILYLQKLQEQKYSLEINENEEQELSKLQNEIYKITILLKEQAENSINDKNHIKNNIVDISHQLKTPLTSMSIMTENMLDFPNMDDNTRQKFLENIKERLEHTELLVQNLLKLSRFDANVIEFKSNKINLKELIENAIEKNKVLISQKGINIIFSCDENIFFNGDFIWQSEAISNIIKNATEHSFEKGKIEISCSMNNFAAKISIKDYGKGIKKENLQKIFTRYYKDENSSEHSLGVGLNLAKTIIEKNHGSIKAISKENEFTIFEIKYFLE